MAYKIKNKKVIEDRLYSMKAPYNEDEYQELARAEGLSYQESLIFAKFMKRRFPNERSSSYVMEWIGRFKTGSPEGSMDEESKEIYEEVKEVLK